MKRTIPTMEKPHIISVLEAFDLQRGQGHTMTFLRSLDGTEIIIAANSQHAAELRERLDKLNKRTVRIVPLPSADLALRGLAGPILIEHHAMRTVVGDFMREYRTLQNTVDGLRRDVEDAVQKLAKSERALAAAHSAARIAAETATQKPMQQPNRR